MKLFEITQTAIENNTHIFNAKLNGEHKIFEGHFPQNPVVPGVCTMAMVKECCGLAIGRGVGFDYIKEVKFLPAILPSQHQSVEVVMSIKGCGDEMCDVSVVVEAQGITMMKLKATVK